MNLYRIVMPGFILFGSFSAIAQQKEEKPPQRPAVTKGYYSIGNNAQKLAPATPLVVKPVSITAPELIKGYYSIGKNRRKLPYEDACIPLYRKRTVITKGFYSIGNNAGKLRN
jgi:hypothetical protein